MIKDKSELKDRKPEIDLTGPDGNAYSVMAYAKSYAEQLGYSDTRTEKMLEDMMSDDYEHLLEVFEKNFGEYVILYR